MSARQPNGPRFEPELELVARLGRVTASPHEVRHAVPAAVAVLEGLGFRFGWQELVERIGLARLVLARGQWPMVDGRGTVVEGEATLARIRATGADRALASALWLMACFWDRTLPPTLAAFAAGRPLDRRTRDHILRRIGATGAPEVEDRWSARRFLDVLRHSSLAGAPPMRVMAAVLAPTLAEWEMVALPRRLYFLYWPLRPLRAGFGILRSLLMQAGRRGIAFLRGTPG